MPVTLAKVLVFGAIGAVMLIGFVLGVLSSPATAATGSILLALLFGFITAVAAAVTLLALTGVGLLIGWAMNDFVDAIYRENRHVPPGRRQPRCDGK